MCKIQYWYIIIFCHVVCANYNILLLLMFGNYKPFIGISKDDELKHDEALISKK